MQKLPSKIQATLRLPLLLAWLVLIFGSTVGYGAVLYWSKKAELISLLDVALQTVNSSLRAGDWDIALSHLTAVARSGGVFEIGVSLRDAAGSANALAGPLGDVPVGFFRICSETGTGTPYLLGGCRKVIETQELYSLILFIVLSSIIIAAVLSFVRRVFGGFVQEISENLEYMAGLSDRDFSGTKHKNSFVVAEIENIRSRLILLVRESALKSRAAVLGDLASQVAHDIRSPLAALTAAEKELGVLPEETRIMIRSAVTRIRDISNHLLERNREASKAGATDAIDSLQGTEDEGALLLPSLIEGILTEKRMQFRSKMGIEIDSHLDASSYGLFAKVQPREFKRVLSNLINNSVEALGDKGIVTLSLAANENNQIEVKVQDNGRGIAPNILAKLGKRGETHGKEGGSGLGLYHARSSVESWGGMLELQSVVGTGTSVLITLPKAAAPSWFVAELRLAPQSTIVVLDDDESIHRIWQGRADSAKLGDFGITLVHVSTPSELRTWKADNTKQHGATQYLLDYELLGFKETGLDLVEELGIAAQSILVTSRYEEPAIRERCNKLKVPFIPKGMAGFVPISVDASIPASRDSSNNPDAILIDDDELVHLTWKVSAKKKGVTLLGFKSVTEFLRTAAPLNRCVPVYIDSFLGNGPDGKPIQGEEISHEISALGFKNIYLATGLAPANPERFTWLTGIRDKDPPFDDIDFALARAQMVTPTPQPMDCTKVRAYCHDLLKPIQQATNVLRLMDTADLSGPEGQAALTEYLPILTGIGQSVTHLQKQRLEMRAQMTDSDLAQIASLDQRILSNYDEISRVTACSPDQIARLKRSGELTQRLKILQVESSALAHDSAALLNANRS